MRYLFSVNVPGKTFLKKLKRNGRNKTVVFKQ